MEPYVQSGEELRLVAFKPKLEGNEKVSYTDIWGQASKQAARL